VQAWIDVLDSIERGVDACEQRYITGEPVDIPVAPSLPSQIGPLPPALEARARAVLARLHEIESKIARIPRPGTHARGGRFGAPDRTTASFEHRV
jgi:hypothetical protein